MAEYIEREAVLKKSVVVDGRRVVAYVDLLEIPAADVAPVRHARWASVGHKIKCSVCANGVFLGTTDPDIHSCEKENFRYCPNCGARMDLEDNDARERL